jgi:hypothetical protein
MSRTQASALAVLACLVAAGCSMTAEPQSGDTRPKQQRDRSVDQPDGMKGGGGGGGGGM